MCNNETKCQKYHTYTCIKNELYAIIYSTLCIYLYCTLRISILVKSGSIYDAIFSVIQVCFFHLMILWEMIIYNLIWKYNIVMKQNLAEVIFNVYTNTITWEIYLVQLVNFFNKLFTFILIQIHSSFKVLFVLLYEIYY